MRVKLEDVCERGSSNLKQSDVIDKTGQYPIYQGDEECKDGIELDAESCHDELRKNFNEY